MEEKRTGSRRGDDRGAEIRDRLIDGVVAGLTGLGSVTVDTIFFSTGVRFAGVVVFSTFRSSSKSNTEASWLLLEWREPVFGDHGSGDDARTGDGEAAFFDS